MTSRKRFERGPWRGGAALILAALAGSALAVMGMASATPQAGPVADRAPAEGADPVTAAPAPDPLGELTGGATTVYADGRNAFSLPAANLADAEHTRFVIGNSRC